MVYFIVRKLDSNEVCDEMLVFTPHISHFPFMRLHVDDVVAAMQSAYLGTLSSLMAANPHSLPHPVVDGARAWFPPVYFLTSGTKCLAWACMHLPDRYISLEVVSDFEITKMFCPSTPISNDRDLHCFKTFFPRRNHALKRKISPGPPRRRKKRQAPRGPTYLFCICPRNGRTSSC